jgi:hypothetical protein
MAILSKAIYIFNVTPITIPKALIMEMEKIKLTVHLEKQSTANTQGNIEQKEKSWRYLNT